MNIAGGNRSKKKKKKKAFCSLDSLNSGDGDGLGEHV